MWECSHASARKVSHFNLIQICSVLNQIWHVSKVQKLHHRYIRVEFMYLAYRVPGASYRRQPSRRLRVTFWVLINSLVYWFCRGARSCSVSDRVSFNSSLRWYTRRETKHVAMLKRLMPPVRVEFEHATKALLGIRHYWKVQQWLGNCVLIRLLKPVLNWANVCSPEHTPDTSTKYDSFLNWIFILPNMVRTVQTLLHSQLACNEMQALARTCGRHHVRKCSQYTLIIPHRVIQLTTHSGSPRQGCAFHKSTSEASEEPRDTAIHFYFRFFFIHRRVLLSANQRQW